MLNSVKLAIPVSTDAYDSELLELIEEAKADLGIAGVTGADDKPLVRRAIKTYCKLHFGSPEDPERLQKSYNEQKAQLQTATGYTDWGDGDGA